MAKFIKSIFQSDKKSSRLEADTEPEPEVVPIDVRRKLSMSRSGRLKHSYKKRHSLSLELYGEDMQATEKPKSLEYHVHTRPVSEHDTQRKVSTTSKSSKLDKRNDGHKSPEEEIDNAFEIIDKS